MSDVNFLPDDLKKEEERERQHRELPHVMPMSTPVVENDGKNKTLNVGQTQKTNGASDVSLPHVRESSYIGVNEQGKIIHEKEPKEQNRRAPWWWSMWSRLRPVKTIRVTETPKAQPSPVTTTPKGVATKETSVPSTPVIRDSAVSKVVPNKPTPPPAPAVKAEPVKPVAPAAKGLRNEPDPLGPPPLGVNLIPSEWSFHKDLSQQFRRNMLLIAVAFFIVVTALSVMGRIWFTRQQEARLTALHAQLDDLDKQIAAGQEKEADWQRLRTRLAMLDTLLSNHVNMLPALKTLETSVIPEVTYSKVTIADDGTMSVSGTTTTYELLAKQVAAFSSALPKPNRVSIAAAALDTKTDVLTFTLNIAIDTSDLRYADK